MPPDAARLGPPKPREGSACNGCGICCATQVCAIGVIAHGDVAAPCPSLLFSHGRTWCGIVVAEPAVGGSRLIAEALGIGVGCDAEGEDGRRLNLDRRR